jgi:hypothetical protein
MEGIVYHLEDWSGEAQTPIAIVDESISIDVSLLLLRCVLLLSLCLN